MIFKKDDIVRVTKKFIPDNSFEWKDVMDSYIGCIYIITSADAENNRYSLNYGWYFPSESLELVCSISNDNIEHPTHYTSGDIECIDAIRSALTPEEFRGYCKGNVLKYTWRERMKGKDEDLKKAKQYLEFMEVKQ